MKKNQRKNKAEQTKQQIIDAAEALFQKKGFAATSMSQVAQYAAVTKSLIHHHFGSKESLWDAVCKRNQQRMCDYLETVMKKDGAGSSEEFLSTIVESFFSHISENPGFSRLQAWVAAEQREKRSMQLERLEELEEKLDSMRGSEIRPDLDPRFIIFVYWSLVEHWHSNKHIYGKRFGVEFNQADDDRYLETAVSIFLDGIKSKTK